MAGSTLETLVVKISADVSDLKVKLDQAVSTSKEGSERIASSFDTAKDAFKEFGLALSAGALIEFTKSAIEAGGELYNMSRRSGVAVESLSALKLAAQENGTSLDGVAQGLKFMQRNLSDAVQGNKTAAQSFNQIGLSAQQLAEKPTIDAMLVIADRISELGSEADRTKALMDIFGRSGAELGNLFSEGSGGIKKAMDQAQRLGLVVSTDEAKQLDEFNTKWTAFVDQCERLAQMSFVKVYDLIDKTAGALATTIDPLAARNLDEVSLAIENLTQRKAELDSQKSHEKDGGDWLNDLLGSPEQLNQNLKQVNDELAAALRMKQVLEASQQNDTNAPTAEKKNNRKLIAAPSDAPTTEDIDSVANFIKKLEEENDVLQQNRTQQAGLAAYYQILNDLREKGSKATAQETQELADNKDKITALANANAELKKQMQEAQKAADEMKRSLSDALTNLAFDFKNAGQAAGDFFKTLAENIFKKTISDPLSNSIVGLFTGSGSGILSSIGQMMGISGARAAGGPVNSGSSYLVGERGPEIFTPNVTGGITPNNKLGGSGTIVVAPVYNISLGVQQTVRAELINLMPAINQSTLQNVQQAIKSGGSFSRVVASA